jgi:hypothetical protein
LSVDEVRHLWDDSWFVFLFRDGVSLNPDRAGYPSWPMKTPFEDHFSSRLYTVGFLLLLNGFLKALKFGEAYLPPYLSSIKGLSLQDIYDRVFPVWTYSYLVFLIPVSLFAENLGGYRGLVWLEAVMDSATYGILYWATVR